uniref:Uncharacterized protein n=1 Tax=Gossypium raimondii TaxID=29730 RepID=A0A0D2QV51_GOSRA|nr:hypothetical protein B456_007G183500 [Gossypium raimondii]
MAVDSEPKLTLSWKDKTFGCEIFETEDYEKVLIVQPWTTDSNSMQPYSNVVKARIRLPGLPGFLYKRRILKEIGGMIGKISKIDFNTDSRMRGKFARMTVHVNFDKPLTSQVLINDTLQWVEFESLPLICFGCGRYDHLKDQPNTLGNGTGFGPIEKGDSAANSPVFVQMEQRAVALEIQPSGILDLNLDSNMV